MVALAIAALAGLLAASSPSIVGICPAWGPAQVTGRLDPKRLPEASGLAVSRRWPGRLYHHNDSGSGPEFLMSDENGGNLRTVGISGFRPIDVEDVALGPCGLASSCLVLGDIGDNQRRRQEIAFVVLAEKATYEAVEQPLRIIRARYPDGPHNAEAIALHPSGDVFLLTKVDGVSPTQVFRLGRDQLVGDPQQVQTLTEVGRIEVAPLFGLRAADRDAVRQATVTGMDISQDGKRVFLVTYLGAAELGFDLTRTLPSQATWKVGRDWLALRFGGRDQTEAIAYTSDDAGFIYDAESDGGASQPLYRRSCAGPSPR